MALGRRTLQCLSLRSGKSAAVGSVVFVIPTPSVVVRTNRYSVWLSVVHSESAYRLFRKPAPRVATAVNPGVSVIPTPSVALHTNRNSVWWSVVDGELDYRTFARPMPGVGTASGASDVPVTVLRSWKHAAVNSVVFGIPTPGIAVGIKRRNVGGSAVDGVSEYRTFNTVTPRVWTLTIRNNHGNAARILVGLTLGDVTET